MSPARGKSAKAVEYAPPPAPPGDRAPLFPPLSPACGEELARLLPVIDETFPLQRRFRAGLPRDIAALSGLLTSRRPERDDGYLGRPAMQSAYLRWFLPWNVYRLCRLLPSLPLSLKAGDALTDLGSGPLTFPLALWIARPEYREVPLEFRCLDRTPSVLESGMKIFTALSGGKSPWKIRTIRASLGSQVRGPKAALVSALNVFNELFWDDRRLLLPLAEKQARYLGSLAAAGGSVFVMEPGIPRSGEFISALRSALLDLHGPGGGPALAAGPAAGHEVPPGDRADPGLLPCPHAGACPFPGGSRGAKWCHFTFPTEGAPEELLALSAAAGLPKERASLSFLFFKKPDHDGPRPNQKTGQKPEAAAAPDLRKGYTHGENIRLRVISDAFALNAGGRQGAEDWGRYACSGRGMVLLKGKRGELENHPSGTLIARPVTGTEQRDGKSGALVVSLTAPTGTRNTLS